MILENIVSIPSRGVPCDRRTYYYLPDDRREGERFPVLYLLDGQAVFSDERAPFGESLRLAEILERENIRIIAAAVECDERDRLSEYSPFPFKSRYGNSEGRGEEFLRWLAYGHKPFVDRWLPTLPDRAHTYLAGCSMGGLMTVYGLSAFAERFGGGIAMSPSLWVDPAGCLKLIDGIPADARLYLDYGEKELSRHARQRGALARAASALAKKGGDFTFRIVKDGTHSERSWRAQMPVALRCVGLAEQTP